MKLIEAEIYHFIVCQVSEKFSRVDAKQREIKGGLNFPDIFPTGLPLNFHGLEELRKAIIHGKKSLFIIYLL